MDLEKAREILKITKGTPMELLEKCKAVWFYQGLPDEPHAVLTAGQHSEGYFHVGLALSFPNVCRILARHLFQKMIAELPGLKGKIDVVASPTFGAPSLGQEFAERAGAMFIYTEKVGEEQIFSERFNIPAGARILIVEDAVSRFTTAGKSETAILKRNPNAEFLREGQRIIVGAVVYRPKKLSISNPNFLAVSLVEKEIKTWKPGKEECPLCKQGSKALRPKQHWEKFQKYII
jgi:orotate phosphoribosyltransferase